jgi:hypothetical protein
MSERSVFLRDQADKCRRHAAAITDDRTQVELRKLAAEYIERATAIEAARRPKATNEAPQ